MKCMKALLFTLSFTLLAPLAAQAAESADGAGPAPASVETPASPHNSDMPGKLPHACLGSLCAEDVGGLTSNAVEVTVEGLSGRK